MIQLAKDNEYYRKSPSLSDQVHCLVNVIPADKTEMMNKLFNEMKPVREEASKLGESVHLKILLDLFKSK